MRKILFTLAALPLLMIGFTGCSHPQPVYAPPPPELSQIARQGFQDGMRAARHDLNHGLPPNAARHPLFRNPPVPYGPPAEDYRNGFRRGYRRMYRQAAAQG